MATLLKSRSARRHVASDEIHFARRMFRVLYTFHRWMPAPDELPPPRFAPFTVIRGGLS